MAERFDALPPRSPSGGRDESGRETLDPRLRQIVGDFRRALLEAASDSVEVHRAWRQLRDEGYALFLVVDLEKQELRPRRLLGSGEPQYLLSSEDAGFLRSIGVDPTRRRRARRRRTKAPVVQVPEE